MSGTPGSLIVETLVRDVLEDEAGRAVIRVASSSMSPRLQAGDRIAIARVSPWALLPGDIVVFRSEAAGLVVHRLIWRNRPLGQPTHVFTKGDALDYMDRSVPVEQIVGKVVSIIGGKDHRSPTSLFDRIRCTALAAGYGVRRWARRRRVALTLSETEQREER